MSVRRDLAYRYDGSLPGLLCCVFESYTRREIPADILLWDTPTLYPCRGIETEEKNAARIWRSLVKLGGEVASWVRTAWLSCSEGRELLLYKFIRRAYAWHAAACARHDDAVVSKVFHLVQAVNNEAHYFKEFLRFSERGGMLTAQIEPKAIVLPFIYDHFADRLMCETFLIYDQSHGMAALYHDGKTSLSTLESLTLPPANEEEEAFQRMWRRYYDTIGIEERYNPACRRTHMPMHFWKNMTEFQDCCAFKDKDVFTRFLGS